MTYIFADPFWGRMSVALVFAVIGLIVWYSVDIVLYLTKRDFTHLHVQIVRFTRYDKDSKFDKVRFRSIDRLRLRPVLNNRYLFLSLLWAGMRATDERPGLSVGDKEHAIFSAIRYEILRRTVNAEFKREAGMSFVDLQYRLFVVRDRSDDNRNFVLRAMLVRERDLAKFESYLPRKNRPKNRNNFELVNKIWSAYSTKTISSIGIDITAA